MIALREDVTLGDVDGVRTWLPEARLSASDRKELAFWSGNPTQSPASDFLDSVLVKALDLPHFERLWPRIGLTAGMKCLEVGAGQGWASVMLQKRVPGAEVHASDVAPDALRVTPRWEAAFGATLAGRWAFPAADAPFAGSQFDRIFMFAALHHLGARNDFSAALTEMRRMLKSDGRIVAFNEPASPHYLYARAFRKINEFRQQGQHADVDEDVLVLDRVRRQAASAGLAMSVEFEPTPIFKETSWIGAVRSRIVRAAPVLHARVSAGVHLTFTPR